LTSMCTLVATIKTTGMTECILTNCYRESCCLAFQPCGRILQLCTRIECETETGGEPGRFSLRQPKSRKPYFFFTSSDQGKKSPLSPSTEASERKYRHADICPGYGNPRMEVWDLYVDHRCWE
jgi:hypothetical protein